MKYIYIYIYIKNRTILLQKEFIKYTKEKLILSNSKISKMKIYGKLRGLSLEEYIHNLNDPNFISQTYSSNIKYIIKLSKNNNGIETKEKLLCLEIRK